MHPALPAGPSEGALAQTVRLHRDPLGTLRDARARFGPVFTMRLATARPLVVVTDAAAVRPLLDSDPELAHAGEARRRILPLASPASSFGGDGAQHRAARGRVAPAFTAEAIAARRPAIEAIATEHVARWPRNRPFRLLARMRALIDDAFARVLLGVEDEARSRAMTVAIRRMLWTPGNPPLGVPGEGDGLLGAATTAAFRRRIAPLATLLGEELRARRSAGARDGDVLSLVAAAEPPLADEAAVDELLPLLMAAQEPPSAGLTWLLDRLARDRALAERYVADGDGGRFRDAVVRETFRVRPPAMAGLRRLLAPREVAGHVLPAGVTVMLPFPLLHRDPAAFPEPDEFRPQRWLDGTPDQRTYAPFGDGARRCLGEHLAHAYVDAIVPAVLRGIALRPLLPRPERMVLRGTILVPHRSGLVRAAGQP
jgi:cytochrome P450 family 135